MKIFIDGDLFQYQLDNHILEKADVQDCIDRIVNMTKATSYEIVTDESIN